MLQTLRRVTVRGSSRRWLVTSRQKRALNPDQLKGSKPAAGSTTTASPPQPPPPPRKTPSAAASAGTPTTSNLVPLGIAAGVAVAGGAYYYYFQSSSSATATVVPKKEAFEPKKRAIEPKKEVVEPKKEVVEPKKEVVESKKEEKIKKKQDEATSSLPTKEEKSDVQTATTKRETPAGNRVTSIQVPAKMKNVPVAVAAESSASSVSAHPVKGNRVVIMVPRKVTKIDDTSMTERAISELQESTKEQATEAVVESHQSLWASMDESFFTDLDSLNSSQLKARIVQLASEMKDRTKWEAVRLKEFLAMKEKETADKYMEILQKQRLEFEDVLARRLREQENGLSQQMQKALQEKEATIQSVLDTALDAQKHEHEEDMKAFQEAKSAEVQSQLEEKYGKDLEEYKNQVANEIQQKVTTLESLSAKLKQLESALAASQTSQRGSVKAHRLSAAALALSEKLEKNRPATVELNALKTAAGKDGVIATALATIPEEVNTGVPTLGELQANFEDVQKKSRQAAMVPEGRPGLDGQLAGMLFANLKYPPTSDDPAPENDKDNAEYVLVRAKKHVQLGELEAAVEQLDKLRGQPAFTVDDWKKAAMNRIAIEKALKVIKMECALVNESLVD